MRGVKTTTDHHVVTLGEYLSLGYNSIMPPIKRPDESSIVHRINHMDSALYDAVIKDDIDVLRVMEGKLSVDEQRTATESTVLHLACQYGSMKCVEHILSTHLSLLSETNSRGESALHMAARQGHCEVVVALINAAKSSHEQPESMALIQSLIRKRNVERETPLHEAVRYNHNNVVQLLVNEDPSDSHCPNKHEETLLYLACTRCYTDIITTLLSNCESPTFGGPEGRTALHAAVLDDGGQCGPRECVKLILDKNRDLISVQDNYGWTVFHYVAYNDLYTIVEDLVDAQKSAAYLSDYYYNRTALHVAADKGNIRVMEELVKYFPDCWEIVDKNSQNILHIAVEQDRKEELMEERALDWEVLNDDNLTPLDLMHCGKKINTLTDQAMIKRTLINANVKKHWQLLGTLKESDFEKAKIVELQNEKDTKEVKEYKKWISAHMIVAALNTTVALTAGFTMPGGFDGNPGPNQGSAFLLRKRSFQAFIVTDTIALLCSIYSLFLYFLATMYVGRVRNLFFLSVLLNISSVLLLLLF